MTGEITLRGLVLPIGGLKEKTLAAKRAGIRQVIVPKRNEKDLPDIPDEVRKTLKFHFVENVDQVLEIGAGGQAAAHQPSAPPTPPRPAAAGRPASAPNRTAIPSPIAPAQAAPGERADPHRKDRHGDDRQTPLNDDRLGFSCPSPGIRTR